MLFLCWNPTNCHFTIVHLLTKVSYRYPQSLVINIFRDSDNIIYSHYNDIKFPREHDITQLSLDQLMYVSTASIIAQLSAAKVLLHTLRIFLLCHVMDSIFLWVKQEKIMKPPWELPSFKIPYDASQKTTKTDSGNSNFLNLRVRGFLSKNLSVLLTIF